MTELERVGRDGSRVPIVPRPGDIHRAVEDLTVGRDAELVLHGTHDDGARYELAVVPVEGGVLVRLTRDGERRWLARAGDDARIEGTSVPRKAVVPRTWAASALGLATMTAGWPSTLPWHDDDFRPITTLALDDVSFARCVAAPDACVEALASTLVDILDASESPGPTIADVIAELRRVGHDLWSIDQHDDAEIWGSDYMRVAEGQGLYLEIGRTTRVYVRFREASAER